MERLEPLSVASVNIRSMLMTRKTAQITLLDVAAGCEIPIAPDALEHGWLGENGHLFIGASALRGIKYKKQGQWRFDEREVRQAARALVQVTWNPDDLVDARLFTGEEEWPGWRAIAGGTMTSKALNARDRDGCPCGPPDTCRRSSGLLENGLPCGLTEDAFRETCAQLVIAGTLPFAALTWNGKKWLVPRAYAVLLDQWEEAVREKNKKVGICAGCGKSGERWERRSSGSNGWVTRCSECTAAEFRPYTGHLRGAAYESVRRTRRADDYLCRLCTTPQRAYYWDHCHDHGLVRGPVCASCNTFEGNGMVFVNRPGSVEHLLECTVCRAHHTLPRRHYEDVIRNHLAAVHRLECPRAGYVSADPVRWQPDGTAVCEIYCPNHSRAPRRWDAELPAAEARQVLRELIEKVLGSEGR
ncbi:endonuclease domain-containing protein [Streptomyces sp. NPDC024089]|uniref:endonuclease domain-containing protein n=1 Tax=Streptomyces sp. NPDC024089 TaxID=3154328 RepID=UPI0033C6B649